MTTYTFRLSAVFADKPTIITPLSEAVNATSWDGPASKAVQLNWIQDTKKKQLILRWKRPEMVAALQKYQLDLVEMER